MAQIASASAIGEVTELPSTDEAIDFLSLLEAIAAEQQTSVGGRD